MSTPVKFSPSQVEKKRRKLHRIAGVLKAKYVGLDKVIDQIIHSIEGWYTMPAVLFRPTIVCLWGMTGVGKTDLVRTLVSEIGFLDRFLEIQLDEADSSRFGWYASDVRAILEYSSIEPNKQGIILFDEIQRFRTLDETGKEKTVSHKFSDVWMLLSDGKFASSGRDKARLEELMLDCLYDIDTEESEKIIPKPPTEGEDKEKPKPVSAEEKKKRKFRRHVYTAQRLKAQLKLDIPVEEIMMWDREKMMSAIMERMEDDTFCAGDDYSKTLIFICGNLDKAYDMSKDVGNADVDADILHKRSLDVNIVRIKEELTGLFKFEQIARFGNTHIIYPSLSRSAYRQLISRKCIEFRHKVHELSGVYMTINQSVRDAIYDNGVYPSQGVRPVLSTFSALLETTVSWLLYKARTNGIDNFSISYRKKDQALVSYMGDEKIEIDVSSTCPLDGIKDRLNPDKKVGISVHEAGHAVVYSILFGLAPVSIKSNLTNYEGGFVFPHTIDSSKSDNMKMVQVLLAGLVTEEFMFGSSNRTGGSASDVRTATTIVGGMLKHHAMGCDIGYVSLPIEPHNTTTVTDSRNANKLTEEYLRQAKKATIELVKENIQFIIEVSDCLIENGEISPEDFQTISEKYLFKKVAVEESNHEVVLQYADMYKSVKERLSGSGVMPPLTEDSCPPDSSMGIDSLFVAKNENIASLKRMKR